MIWLFAWLCLWVLAHAISMQSLTPTEGKEVTAPASDGAGFSTDLFWVNQGTPSDDWGLSGWIFIRIAADSAQLMRVRLAPTNDFYFKWPAAGMPTFNQGGTDYSDPAAPPARQTNKWFHVAMGSQGGKSHGVVTLRGMGTQYEIQWTASLKVMGATTLMGPVGDSTFSVREI